MPLHRNASRTLRVEYALSTSFRSGLLLRVTPLPRMIEMSAISEVKATELCRCPSW
jgi:hypothetical protein